MHQWLYLARVCAELLWLRLGWALRCALACFFHPRTTAVFATSTPSHSSLSTSIDNRCGDTTASQDTQGDASQPLMRGGRKRINAEADCSTGKVGRDTSRSFVRGCRMVLIGDGFAEGFGDFSFIPGPQVGLARAINLRLARARARGASSMCVIGPFDSRVGGIRVLPDSFSFFPTQNQQSGRQGRGMSSSALSSFSFSSSASTSFASPSLKRLKLKLPWSVESYGYFASVTEDWHPDASGKQPGSKEAEQCYIDIQNTKGYSDQECFRPNGKERKLCNASVNSPMLPSSISPLYRLSLFSSLC